MKSAAAPARSRNVDQLALLALLLRRVVHPRAGGGRRSARGGLGALRRLPRGARPLEGRLGSPVARPQRRGRLTRVERRAVRLPPELELRARPAHRLLRQEAPLLSPVVRHDRLPLGGGRLRQRQRVLHLVVDLLVGPHASDQEKCSEHECE